ncbi:MAG: hypothetical protein NWQ31_03615 [Polaribacter sp.]|nr:hypothetical protein [Polaribacter sp.]
MKKYNLLICFLIGFTSFAQNYIGSLKGVEKDGFQKILLPSKVRAASANNFDFIRIKDSVHQEVPYVIKYQSDSFFSTFLPIQMLSKKSSKDSITSILIENKTAKKQSNLVLQIANTAISKQYNILGSNDAVHWFGISSNNILNLTNESNSVSVEKRINFPLNTYQFLKIELNDKNSLPINVLGVGVYENEFFSEESIEIASFRQEISQLKDRKVTQIKFTSKDDHQINSISFDIKTALFLRNAKIIVSRTHHIKKREEVYKEVIASFELSSKNENTFTLNNFYEKEFVVEIDNQDNLPVEITGIKLLQNPIYLISNLKQHQKYQFIIDTTLSKPSYDLGNFLSDSIINVGQVSIVDFLKINKKDLQIKEKPFWQTRLFMWICIIFVSLFIVYFALDLVKNVKHQEKK